MKNNNTAPNDMPEGLQFQQNTCYGIRKSHPGVFEIKFHYPKLKQALNGAQERFLGKIINEANQNDDVKVILLHGGRFFSSGNDLS